ncbi:MAG: hypothetical protein R6V73_01555 [Anaerolineales bacterium]
MKSPLHADILHPYFIHKHLQFIYDVDAPLINISSTAATQYVHPDYLTLAFSAMDVGSAGLKEVWADLDGIPVVSDQVIDLHTLAKGNLFTTQVILKAFIQKVENQSGIHITPETAALLVADARWVLDHLGELSSTALSYIRNLAVPLLPTRPIRSIRDQIRCQLSFYALRALAVDLFSPPPTPIRLYNRFRSSTNPTAIYHEQVFTDRRPNRPHRKTPPQQNLPGRTCRRGQDHRRR